MAREIEAALNAAAQEDTIPLVILVKLEYDSGDVLVNSTNKNIIFMGDTFLGIGQFGSVSGISDASSTVSYDTLITDLQN